ncbi:F-box domain-containing protein [Favolaschia claudopus]|uniref:F-box domain-containing protein n=1 Tax=Favolaschia claudopus TaxID=2862362 RepID=A0AAW0DAD8_9AGAR
MFGEYDSQGDVIMRDATHWQDALLLVADLAMDSLADKFSRCHLNEPPIHRVPDDVLYELFMSLAGHPCAESFYALVSLSHVCSNWRSIILHAPLLWRFVAMYFSGSCRDHSATIQSFLHRSRDQPITFACNFRRGLIHNWAAKRSLLPILGEHASRIRSLSFSADSLPILCSRHADLSSLSFPTLEYHTAAFKSDFQPGSYTILSRVHGLGFKFPQFIPTAFRSWPSWPSHLDITSLSFEYCSLKLEDIFLLVQMAQYTLQHLKLYFQTRQDCISQTHWLLMDGDIIELPKLTSMDIGFDDPLSLVPFLNRIEVPVLVSLRVLDFSFFPDPKLGRPSTALAQLPPFPLVLLPHYNSTQLPPSLEFFLDGLIDAITTPKLLTYDSEAEASRWGIQQITIHGMSADKLSRYEWLQRFVGRGSVGKVLCRDEAEPFPQLHIIMEDAASGR